MITSAPWWLWLLLLVPVHWAVGRGARDGVIALASIGFLAFHEPVHVPLLVGWAVLAWGLAPRARSRRGLTSTLVLLLLGWLALFKYAPPLVAAWAPESAFAALAVPLGISYFTFKTIHYVLEVARGNVEPAPLWTTLGWLFLLPTFTAGPIERFDHYQRERSHEWSSDHLLHGATRIVHGLIKKFALAEATLRPMLEELGGVEAVLRGDVGDAWAYCGLTFLIVYLDFAAYSDLAIGASRLFGLRIMENFDAPFRATSIQEFWTRWHMTLSGFCRAYVYLPTIGLTRQPYVAVFATWIAIGLWHAGTWSYLVWGAYHAAGVAIAQVWRRNGPKGAWWRGRPATAIAWGLTMAFVISSFATTARATDVDGLATGFPLWLRLFGVDA